MATDFELRFIHPFRSVEIGRIKKFSHLEYVIKENEAGIMDLYFPLGMIDPSFFRIDIQVEIWRRPEGMNNSYLEGETAFFIRRPVRTISTSSERLLHITAMSAFELIDRIVVPYSTAGSGGAGSISTDGSSLSHSGSASKSLSPSASLSISPSSSASASASPSVAPIDYVNKWDCADDIMKELIREEGGSLAEDPGRNREPYLTVSADTSEAPVIRKVCSRAKLPDIFKDLINSSQQQGVYLVYDVVRTAPNRYEFRTYTGQRGVYRNLIVSQESGNLNAPTLTEDYSTESNVIYAAGVGVGSAQIQTLSLDYSRIAISPYNRREFIFDAKNTGTDPSSPDTLDRLQSESDSELNALRPRVMLSGQILDTPSTHYGDDFNWGDIIRAKAFEYTLPVHIYSVHNTVEAGQETLDIQVQGETYL